MNVSLRRARASLLAIAAVLVAGVACSSSSASSSPSAPPSSVPAAAAPAAGAAAATAAKQEGRTVIDVRTPAEFASGHVQGATNIDLQGAGFAAAIGQLDRGGRYVVYCRSGNRSAQAAAQLRAAGLDVVDGGGLTAMAQAGWPTAS